MKKTLTLTVALWSVYFVGLSQQDSSGVFIGHDSLFPYVYVRIDGNGGFLPPRVCNADSMIFVNGWENIIPTGWEAFDTCLGCPVFWDGVELIKKCAPEKDSSYGIKNWYSPTDDFQCDPDGASPPGPVYSWSQAYIPLKDSVTSKTDADAIQFCLYVLHQIIKRGIGEFYPDDSLLGNGSFIDITASTFWNLGMNDIASFEHFGQALAFRAMLDSLGMPSWLALAHVANQDIAYPLVIVLADTSYVLVDPSANVLYRDIIGNPIDIREMIRLYKNGEKDSVQVSNMFTEFQSLFLSTDMCVSWRDATYGYKRTPNFWPSVRGSPQPGRYRQVGIVRPWDYFGHTLPTIRRIVQSYSQWSSLFESRLDVGTIVLCIDHVIDRPGQPAGNGQDVQDLIDNALQN